MPNAVATGCAACDAGIFATVGWTGSCGHAHRQVVAVDPDGRTTDLDAGIASVVREMWRQGIRTVSSCEGHGTVDGNAFVMLDRGQAREQADLATSIVGRSCQIEWLSWGHWSLRWPAEVA